MSISRWMQGESCVFHHPSWEWEAMKLFAYARDALDLFSRRAKQLRESSSITASNPENEVGLSSPKVGQTLEFVERRIKDANEFYHLADLQTIERSPDDYKWDEIPLETADDDDQSSDVLPEGKDWSSFTDPTLKNFNIPDDWEFE